MIGFMVKFSGKPYSPPMPPASPIKAFLKLPDIAQFNSRRHLLLVQSLSKPPQASSPPIQRPFVDLEETKAQKCKNFLSDHHFLNCLCYHFLDLSHNIGLHLNQS
jgi:hypothetical protein